MVDHSVDWKADYWAAQTAVYLVDRLVVVMVDQMAAMRVDGSVEKKAVV